MFYITCLFVLTSSSNAICNILTKYRNVVCIIYIYIHILYVYIYNICISICINVFRITRASIYISAHLSLRTKRNKSSFYFLLLKLFKTLRPIRRTFIDENGPCDFTPFFILLFFSFSSFLFFSFSSFLDEANEKVFVTTTMEKLLITYDIIKHSPKIGRTRAILAHSFSFFLSFFFSPFFFFPFFSFF